VGGFYTCVTVSCDILLAWAGAPIKLFKDDFYTQAYLSFLILQHGHSEILNLSYSLKYLFEKKK